MRPTREKAHPLEQRGRSGCLSLAISLVSVACSPRSRSLSPNPPPLHRHQIHCLVLGGGIVGGDLRRVLVGLVACIVDDLKALSLSRSLVLSFVGLVGGLEFSVPSPSTSTIWLPLLLMSCRSLLLSSAILPRLLRSSFKYAPYQNLSLSLWRGVSFHRSTHHEQQTAKGHH